MTLMRKTAAVLLTAFCLIGPPASAQSALPGFGSDEGSPVGAPFSLPAGLEIAGPLVGADDDGNCPRPYTEDVGSGLWVRACLPVRNRTGGPVSVTFPPGLVIVAAAEGFQNGLLVERVVLTVPPTGSGSGRLRDREEAPDTVYLPLHFYCINSAKSGSTPGTDYRIGPVTSPGALAEVFRLMEGKDIRGDGERVEVVQEVIYDTIRQGVLTQENREALEAL